MSNEAVTLSAILVAETPKAILVDVGLDKHQWVPRSISDCEEQELDDIGTGECFDLVIPLWFAEKEGLI